MLIRSQLKYASRALLSSAIHSGVVNLDYLQIHDLILKNIVKLGERYRFKIKAGKGKKFVSGIVQQHEDICCDEHGSSYSFSLLTNQS